MTLEDLYLSYYASDREREWYEVCADDKARNILDFCAPLKPRHVLDIGAGNGAVTARVLEAGLAQEIDAAEISDSGLHELQKRLGDRIHDIRKFDGLRLPYDDDRFDLAILSHVVEHVEHPRLLLHEARRVARHLYAEVPLEDVAFKSNLHGDFVMDTTGHINYYNRHTIKRLLQTSGWKVLHQEVRDTSVAPHRFLKGRRGVLEHAVKRAAFRLFPTLSQHFFVFHACLLCQRADRFSMSLGNVLVPTAN
jgi:SAM-dependent methyltransferase